MRPRQGHIPGRIDTSTRRRRTAPRPAKSSSCSSASPCGSRSSPRAPGSSTRACARTRRAPRARCARWSRARWTIRWASRRSGRRSEPWSPRKDRETSRSSSRSTTCRFRFPRCDPPTSGASSWRSASDGASRRAWTRAASSSCAPSRCTGSSVRMSSDTSAATTCTISTPSWERRRTTTRWTRSTAWSSGAPNSTRRSRCARTSPRRTC
mmetsp:Transcript_12039/g.51832  ORF Transcript_12039/g.51832 Transcript_12039/m.51832 type:complete len:210 (-) Transcript_12039:24-653(-)